MPIVNRSSRGPTSVKTLRRNAAHSIGSRPTSRSLTSARILAAGMHDADHPVFVSTLTVDADSFSRRHPDVTADQGQARILRSVLMKPESETNVAALHDRLLRLAGG